MKAVNVLFRVNRERDFFFIYMLGKGELDQNSVDGRVGVQLCD